VRNHKQQEHQQGSAIIWILIWLCGLAGIAWAGYTYAIPRYEQKIQAAVSDSIAGQSDLPIIVATRGSVITLSGQTASTESLSAIVTAAASTPGVRAVKSNLTLADPDQLIQADSDGPVQIAQIDLKESAQTTREGTTLSPAGNLDETPDAQVTEQTEEANLPVESNLPEAEETASAAVNETTPLELPTFKLRISEEILVVEGRMSNGDDTNQLIQNAMTVFDVDVVSNGLILSDDVADAVWLTPIEQILLLMAPISDPQISVLEKQITIAGAAPDRNVHDAVISEALNSLGEFSLVERVSIDPVPVKTDTLAANAAVTLNDSESVEPEPTSQVAEESLPAAENQPEAGSAVQTEADDAAEDESTTESVEPAPSDATVENTATVNETDSESDGDSETETETETETESESESESKEPKASVEQEDTETSVASEDDAEPDTEVSVAPEADVVLEADAEPDNESSVGPEAEIPEELETAVGAENPVESEASAEIQSETAVDSQVSAEPAAKNPMESAASADPAVETPSTANESTTAESAPATASEELAGNTSSDKGTVEYATNAESTVEADTSKKAVDPAIKSEETQTDSSDALANNSAEPDDSDQVDEIVDPASTDENSAPVEPEPLVVSEAPTVIEDPVQQMPDEDLRSALSELPTLRILFETDVNVLTPESQDVLDQIASILVRFPDTNVAIEGHTDTTGDSELNLGLSLLRATTVRDYLIGKGVSIYNLRALGFGEEVPIADNQTAEGRAINRRIEFTF